MKRRKSYRLLAPGILLLVMLLAIFPKAYLHNYFSEHTEQSHTCHAEWPGKACLHNWGYACEVNDTVVSSHYNLTEISKVSPPAFINVIFPATCLPLYLPVVKSSLDSRGPPSQS